EKSFYSKVLLNDLAAFGSIKSRLYHNRILTRTVKKTIAYLPHKGVLCIQNIDLTQLGLFVFPRMAGSVYQ
ncbi:MAG TPA: hypothetical protein PKA82_13435, partial [Pyrinomonadaceae bacterium]|nr:hypothetical protein [Pyrinomonadaceae bacterium]